MALRISLLLQLKDSLEDSMLIRGTVLDIENQYQTKELRGFHQLYGVLALIYG